MSNLNLGPKSLFAPNEFLSKEQCKALFDRIVALGKGGGETAISIVSRYTGGATWVRNRVHLTRQVAGIEIDIRRTIRGAGAAMLTTRMDDEGLIEAIRRAEAALLWRRESPETLIDPPLHEETLKPVLWSDATYATTGVQRGELAQRLINPAEAEGLLSAGELLISGQGHASINTSDVFRYYPVTKVACSMSVRNAKGTASGWAGQTHYDMAKIDPIALGARALDKCVKSADPVRIEPGFYTTILEPQAVADLMAPLMGHDSSAMSRDGAERGAGPFALSPGRSKIGLQVLDRRLRVRSDPMDPDAGFVPFERYSGDPYQAVSWMDDGYLRDLWYLRDYALSNLNKPQPLYLQGSFRLSSNTPPVSMDDMIKSTQRGILVTRFHNVEMIDLKSMLCTGYTRDGLWLIKDGKIAQPLKNFRFTESPLFVLNRLEAVGTPVRVFDQDYARVLPPVKVRDFSFTSLADAV